MRHCCKPECDKPAEYEIWFGSTPEQFFDACLEHIPDLLTDAPRHILTTIEGVPSR